MKVVKKQRNSRMCAVCGVENEFGLRASFYTMGDGSVMSRFSFRPEHQSYPGRVHGGLITAMLDELGFRAVWVYEEETLGVTISLETKFRRPVPYDTPLRGVGRVVKQSRRFVRSRAEIYDLDGNLLAGADAEYVKLERSRVTDADPHAELFYAVEDGVTDIE